MIHMSHRPSSHCHSSLRLNTRFGCTIYVAGPSNNEIIARKILTPKTLKSGAARLSLQDDAHRIVGSIISC